MAFISTRGAPPVPFSQALFQGLAPDGGLYVPETAWSMNEPTPQPGTPAFADTARWVAQALLGDAVDAATLNAVVGDALDFPIPLVEVEPGVHVMELFHGPSLAFKDVGARFMARTMAALSADNTPRTVLVATSGDTGGAVAAAFHGVAPYRVVALYPKDGISERQRRQMTTLGGNVVAVAVDGTFDDCQRLAKGAFADAELRVRCGLTSANSINIGRLIPQAFYYVHAARLLGWGAAPATFVVPSGNLGNLCAGLLARAAGMPVEGFVAATNRNRVFPDYLDSGAFTATASVPTVSNAMDVGDPSNLERIRWLFHDDVDALRRVVRGAWVSDDDTRACIRRVARDTGYVLDPHAAVGWTAMEGLRSRDDGPWVVLATAHPCKFPEVVEQATGVPVEVPEALASRLARPEHVDQIGADAGALRDLLLRGVQ